MKKRLLISWGNTYVFYETVVPLIPKLAENFSVSVILPDFFIPEKTFESLKTMVANGLIEGYWILPDSRNLLRHHLFIKSKLKTWRNYNFDMFLSISGVLVIDQYLSQCVLPRHCIRVCFWSASGYLLRNPELVRKLLGDSDLAPSFIREKTPKFKRHNFIYELFHKIKRAGSFDKVLRLGFQRIRLLIYSIFIKRFRNYIHRFLLPLLLVRKAFPLSKYDKITQIASDKADAFIFCDELEAKVFTALTKKAHVYMARYPTQGGCRCGDIQTVKDAILVPLSNFGESTQLLEEVLSIIYRDIQIVLSESGAKIVHLRLHPRTKKSCFWPQQLLEYLRSKGIDAYIVDSQRPIREVMCDYLGMAGSASSSLRDGRASCDYAFVVGFISIAKEIITSNPRLMFGNSEGIGWVEENGTYDPAIFRRHKFSPPVRKSLDEILLELINIKKGE